MGNCQAIDAASLVIQHPSGRVERYYWPMTVGEVMRLNQGHYVALVITLGLSPSEEENKAVTVNKPEPGVRFTRVKLLRPTETLVLGQAYRLITSDEVMKGLWEKKYAKMKKKKELESPQRVHQKNDSSREVESTSSEQDNMNKSVKHERHRQKTASSSSSSSLARSRMWRPSLQSISEAAS